MQGNHSGVINWDEYVEKYAAFINKNKVKKYFELDVDSVTGYKKVLQMRKDLERLTGIQPIPVWHKSRGKDEFIRMCDEFPYVALGGIVSKEWSINEHKYFPWFIKNAHDKGCKIHGLGYTNLEGLKVNHFDSVDSTAWTTGNRFGYLYKFNGKTIKKIESPVGCRIKEPRKVALMNYLEWIKFQMYAKNNL